ncbi:PDR/VanB family oxidoreductase [Pseudonocardia xishanensis]|uniref:PDR/VanB family oxidoreductase n=2 Tax=Pseudonocardia xishanensis TaxID=630995 RepID=A0ABP8RDF5_9PSEU
MEPGGLDMVVAARRHHGDVVVLDLRRRTGQAPLPAWEAGAHIDLVLSPEIVRQYSLCGDTGVGSVWRIAVLREESGRGGSRLVHDSLHVGTGVVVRGPRNNFPLRSSASYLFIAGGIGITPLVPMIAAAQARGADWTLLYGGRTARSMVFADELATRYCARVRLRPQDEHGLLDLDRELARLAPDTSIYCCGPALLLDAVTAVSARRMRAGSLHTERFTPVTPVERAHDRPFRVRLAHTGLTADVPADRSVLDVLRDAGVPVLSSCNEGTCGTCETSVLDGRVDHRDSILDDAERAENKTMMICVSRASGSGDLVLDL